jgi:ATP phosphoribosyltransferase regulatory subunit
VSTSSGGPLDRTPSGTRDFLPDEMRELRALSDRVRSVFDAAGYGEVYTPALEFETALPRASAPRPAYRVFDEHGHALVLRADMTVPIARLAATRYSHADPPLRFCYLAHAYRGVRPQRGQSREFLQAGVELLGVPGAAGTAEVLSTLCAALAAAGLTRFRIGVGDAALYPTLLASAGVGAAARERILADLVRGDFVGVGREVDALDLPADTAALLLRIPRMRGGPEMLDTVPAAAAEALEGMRALHAALARDVAERIIYDLGLVRHLGYYTGAIFQVYDPAYGVPIGSGGRYDELVGVFGRPLPAVGFALNVERLHIALTAEEGESPGGDSLESSPGANSRGEQP